MRPGDKRARFVRVCERRTRKAMKAIRLLSKCFLSPWYEYDRRDIEQVARVMDEEVARIHGTIANLDEPTFSLRDRQPSLQAEPQTIALGKSHNPNKGRPIRYTP